MVSATPDLAYVALVNDDAVMVFTSDGVWDMVYEMPQNTVLSASDMWKNSDGYYGSLCCCGCASCCVFGTAADEDVYDGVYEVKMGVKFVPTPATAAASVMVLLKHIYT